MLENPKQNEGIKSGLDVGFLRTRNKTKRSNLGGMPENQKQNEVIKSGRDAREPETKEGIAHVQRCKERAMPQSKASIPC